MNPTLMDTEIAQERRLVTDVRGYRSGLTQCAAGRARRSGDYARDFLDAIFVVR